MSVRPDLNLLIVFDAIMSERNLRLAAERLGRSQPAVSQSVARLRDILGDRLFEKTPKGVKPTQRAEALWLEIRDSLHLIDQALTHSEFDPKLVSTQVSIGLADDVHEMAFADIVSDLRERAPGVVLRVAEVDHQSVWRDVGDGRVDLAVSVAPPPPRGLGAATLLEQPFVILHRPDVSPPTTLKSYLKSTHAAVGFRDEEAGYTDQRLANMGHNREVIAWTPRFGSIPDLVARTGALATMPDPIARWHAKRFNLAIAKLPFDLDAVPVRLCWHQRRRTDPLNMWLRDQVQETVLRRMRS
ncbi:LysR family transcriptional regulator [uncultured Roseobacter sp.]|uniref:LysR family transcriptional regulator n=1 Tax=uncultured Roseobacter sp. TaxID=114847 RepID=UPI00261CD07D|nr:LysR family transcriptional regulator [uncultured Roseobacter sp.]